MLPNEEGTEMDAARIFFPHVDHRMGTKYNHHHRFTYIHPMGGCSTGLAICDGAFASYMILYGSDTIRFLDILILVRLHVAHILSFAKYHLTSVSIAILCPSKCNPSTGAPSNIFLSRHLYALHMPLFFFFRGILMT